MDDSLILGTELWIACYVVSFADFEYLFKESNGESVILVNVSFFLFSRSKGNELVSLINYPTTNQQSWVNTFWFIPSLRMSSILSAVNLSGEGIWGIRLSFRVLPSLQSSAKRRSPGLVNFVTAPAYHSCLALPAAFTQPGDHLLAEPCRLSGRSLLFLDTYWRLLLYPLSFPPCDFQSVIISEKTQSLTHPYSKILEYRLFVLSLNSLNRPFEIT